MDLLLYPRDMATYILIHLEKLPFLVDLKKQMNFVMIWLPLNHGELGDILTVLEILQFSQSMIWCTLSLMESLLYSIWMVKVGILSSTQTEIIF